MNDENQADQRGLAPHLDSLGARAAHLEDAAGEVLALTQLNDVNSRLWHVSSVAEGLQEILRAAIALLGADKGTVHVLDGDDGLRVAANAGFAAASPESSNELGAKHDPRASALALRTGRRIVVEDVDSDESHASLRELARAAGYCAVQATPIVNREGRTLGTISTHFCAPHRPSDRSLRRFDRYVRLAADFIDRCNAEAQLQHSEPWLKALTNIAPATMLWAAAPGGACTFVSRGWHEYTGIPAGESAGMRWFEAIHVDDREGVHAAFEAASSTQAPFVMDYRMRRADGEYRWVQVAGRPRITDDGEFLGFVGSVVDIHERKVAEQALRDNEAILAGQKEAFQAAMSGRPLAACLNVLVRTAVERYGDARAAFYMLVEGRGGLHHVTMRDIAPDLELGAEWGSWSWEEREQNYPGCWSFPVQTHGGPILGTFALYFPQPRKPEPADLNMIAALAHAAAIVISKYAEAAERARAEEALKDTNRRKDEFLAVLGHELRNPLAPLSTAADLLEYSAKRPDLLDTVRPMMRRQIDHLTRLVDDLLDVSRISRGHAELQKAPLDLRTAVESAIEQSEPLIAAQKHRLSVRLGDVPLRAEGDFQRLTQVFVNLLSNAAKYSAPGSEIVVHAAREGDEALICVADRGYGIPKERVREVFEMFSQVPEHRSLVGGGGLGIGLALCRQLVELHGGAIAAQSEGLGKGSEFCVRLPLAGAARDEAHPVGEPPAAGALHRRVLVVDDNVDAATALRMVLEQQGHEARAVFDGRAALEALSEGEADVVLLDLGMPLMDGFEVARAIRQTPNGQKVLLVALTGWGQDQDRQRTAEAGFDAHLTKPVDAAQLSKLLSPHGDGSSTRRGPNAVPGSPPSDRVLSSPAA